MAFQVCSQERKQLVAVPMRSERVIGALNDGNSDLLAAHEVADDSSALFEQHGVSRVGGREDEVDLGALTRLVFFNETQENASSLSPDAG